MKDNLNIEELFKSKFDGFEGNVDPSAWANISQSIGGGASGGAVASGLSGVAKVAIISGVVAVTAVSAWYFSSKSEENNVVVTETENNVSTEEELISSTQTMGDNILVNDTNDPMIQENVDQIQDELSEIQNQIDLHPEDINNQVVQELFGMNLIADLNKGTNIGNNIGETNNDNVVENKEDNIVVHENPDKEVTVQDADVLEALSFTLEHDLNDKELTVNSNAENYNKVVWDFGDGTVQYGAEMTHEYERPGTYEVTVEVHGTVEAIVQKFEVTVEGTSSMEEIANTFTPSNRDGINDFFFIESVDIETFYISIRDRRGEEVFSSTDSDFEWNGEKRDGSIEMGNYTYIVIAEGEDGQIFKKQGALIIK